MLWLEGKVYNFLRTPAEGEKKERNVIEVVETMANGRSRIIAVNDYSKDLTNGGYKFRSGDTVLLPVADASYVSNKGYLVPGLAYFGMKEAPKVNGNGNGNGEGKAAQDAAKKSPF